MGPVFTKPPAVMARCCASSCKGWGGADLCAPAAGLSWLAANGAMVKRRIPAGSSRRQTTPGMAFNMAVSIRGAMVASLTESLSGGLRPWRAVRRSGSFAALRMTSFVVAKSGSFAALRMTSFVVVKSRSFAALRMTSFVVAKSRSFAALRMTKRARSRSFAALRMTTMLYEKQVLRCAQDDKTLQEAGPSLRSG